MAQGTGSDWGPYWLGSGEQVSANQAANVEPYVRAAIEHGVPFVFSFGIAGADPHLDTCLEAFDALCLRNGWSLDVGVVRSEVDRDLLLATIAGGQPVRPRRARARRCRPDSPPTTSRRQSGSWPSSVPSR